MTDELKPVPCGCGGNTKIGNNIWNYDTGRFEEYYVYCEDCLTATGAYESEAEAITAWNRAMGSTEKSSTVERTAKVENIEDPAGLGVYGDCSECGAEVTEQYAYCPNCGCRLEWE